MVVSNTFASRHQLILDSAMKIIEDGGTHLVSMAALAKSTGLSRPAIYQYFSSREHVLGELMLNEMADLSNEIERLGIGVEDPMERIRIWMHYSVAHLASDKHGVVRQISIDTLPEDQRGMLRAMHGYFMMSLISPLTELGVEDPAAVCSLIYGAVASAAKRIDEGSDFSSEAKALGKFVSAGLGRVL